MPLKNTLEVSLKTLLETLRSFMTSVLSDMVLKVESSTGLSETPGEPTGEKMDSLELLEEPTISLLRATVPGLTQLIPGLKERSTLPLMRRRTTLKTTQLTVHTQKVLSS